MKRIITLTINPAIDKSTSVNGIRPDEKLRCAPPVFEAGGGGINVSRAIKKLGGDSLAIYLAGGPTGTHLGKMLKEEGIEWMEIPIGDWTRENLAVTDSFNNQQYRFGMPGPLVQETEWMEVLHLLPRLLKRGDLLVGSGSLCPGVPENFYALVGAVAKKNGAKMILDTSGQALKLGVAEGVYLLKPNLGELGSLCGVESISSANMEAMALRLIKEKKCGVMVVSMGPRGALLVTPNELEYIRAPTVRQNSTIGAGDSMVAGMVLSLAMGSSLREMVRYGVACGTAATMTPGSQLCLKKDVDDLYDWLLAHKGSVKKIDGRQMY